MKIVVQTQIWENYGAHDWDGQGECPQYWKGKGGNTYVVNDVSIADAMSEEFSKSIEQAIVLGNEYFMEDIIGWDLIDDVDWNVSDHVPHWDSPIYLRNVDGVFKANQTYINDHLYRQEIAKEFKAWDQVAGGQENYQSSYEMVNGDVILHQELSEWFEKYVEAA